MLSRSRITIAAVLATAALGSSPSLAMAVPGDVRGEFAAGLADSPAVSISPQGEHAASLSGSTARSERPAESVRGRGLRPPISDGPKADLRTEAATEPFAGPVVVEVGNPVSTGFDWTAAIIGIGGGLAIAVLASVGVAGGRRRHAQPRSV